MKIVYFIINLLPCLGALGKPFQIELRKNVERYKYNNFRWNIRNRHTDTFTSLRDLEERKDKEFSEYMVQQKNILKLRNTKYTRHGMLQPKSKNNKLNGVEKKGTAEAVRSLAEVSPQTMKYASQLGESPLVMMYNDQLMTEMVEPFSMMYKTQPKPQTMMYNARKKRSPQVMMYNDQLMTEMAQPFSMKYETQPKLQTMMYNARGPEVMMYNDQLMTEMVEPFSMMYKTQPKPQTMMYNARKKRSPLAMMYNDQLMTEMAQPFTMKYETQPKLQTMMYNARAPEVMMYNDQLMTEMVEPFSMMNKTEPKTQTMMYNAPKKRSPQVMMYNDQLMTEMAQPFSMKYETQPKLQTMMYNARGPEVMMYNDQLMTEMVEPFSMMYKTDPKPQTMMYNARKKRSPQVMMYNDQLMTEMAQPFSMKYETQPKLQTMMYNARAPEVMMYNDQLMTEMVEPFSMMYKTDPKPQTMMYNARKKRSPQVMMYNDQLMTEMGQPFSMKYETQPKLQTMMYNARGPEVMMYNDQLMTEMVEPFSMMYKTDPKPQTMMYNARKKRSPQVMMYNDQLMTEMAQPFSMKYETQPKLQTMMYNAHAPEVMMYNDQLMSEMVEPFSMMYKTDPKPQTMMYNARKRSIFQNVDMEVSKGVNGIMNSEKANVNIQSIDIVSKSPYNNTPLSPLVDMQFLEGDRKASVDILLNDTYPVIDRTTEWFNYAKALVKPVPKTADRFFRRWKHTISVFNEMDLSHQLFISRFPVLRIKTLIQKVATSSVFEKLFWPFVFENAFMNQKLGLLGLSGQLVPQEEQKSVFYEVLEKYQTVRIPFARDQIVLSFNDSDLIDGLNRSGLMETSKEYVNAGLHLYTLDEQTAIRQKVDEAMTMINNSMPELYKAIHQVIGCIAFYKAQRAGFAGGTVSSALGVIWQDPRAYKEQSVAHYAEQIVHEYIHSSLFLADLVHGTFANYNLLSRAKAYSPIRRQLRDFDKVFHASYVSTGVAVFHARAGNWDKAHELLEPLAASVNDLDAVNTEYSLLNDSGNAMLQAMKDFLTLIRLI